MQFTKYQHFFIIFVIAITAMNSSAKALKTPKFLTKQSLEYLRYIDSDGKYTYYQTTTGQLNMTTNYDNTVLFQASKGSHYQIQSTPDGKMLIIELIENHHSRLDINRNHRIFITKLGEKKLREVALGRMPILALDNKWLGYYTHQNNSVHFKPIIGPGSEIEITLGNKINNFFMPQLLMLTPDTIIYTDINQIGHMAIIVYNSTDKKFSTLYKSKFPGTKVEYCLLDSNLVVGEFSPYDINRGSTIVSVPLFNNKNYQQKDVIYRTSNNDIGNILCKKNTVFFIKTLKFNSTLNSKTTEVAELDLKTKQIKVLSDLKNVTQIVTMGERILIPYRQFFYIIKGDYDTTKKDAL
jgi:hypothetical protein